MYITSRILGGVYIIKNYIFILVSAFGIIFIQEPPAEFQFYQSSIQGSYFFPNVLLNGDICVGANQWDTSQYV